jgi:AraC-like DNA-binding protein/mannose-6-phosphate isomerase-like protein (cupin superfamily)
MSAVERPMKFSGTLSIAREPAPSAAELYSAKNLKDFATGLHFHSEVQIVVVSEGERKFTFRGETLVLTEGDCLIIPAYEPHFGSSLTDKPATFKSVYVSDTCLQDLPALEGCFSGELGPMVLHAPDFARIFAGETTEDGLDVDLIRKFLDRNRSEMSKARSVPTEVGDRQLATVLSSVRTILAKEMTKPPSLNMLSKKMGVSKFYLTRQFSKLYGMSPYAFNLRCRLNEAKVLLAKGEPVCAVAHDLGFFDQSHFGLHFRRVLGFSPAAYQKILH